MESPFRKDVATTTRESYGIKDGEMTKDEDITTNFVLHKQPEYLDWQCYMFGNRPGKIGMIYRPVKGYEPNWFVRWMMKVCFDCLWVKEKNT